jgi:hypothetical protein
VNPGILNFSWTGDNTQANLAGFDVSLNNSAPLQLGLGTTYQWTAAVHSTSYTARVRTRDAFGQTSEWLPAYATGVNDTTPPGCPTPSIAWNQSIPGFTITYGAFTDLQGGTFGLEISYDRGVSVATTVTTLTAGGGTYNHTITSDRRGTQVSYRTWAYDGYNNFGASTWITVTAKPLGTFYVLASQTRTWKTAGTDAWRTDTQDVISGYYDTVNGIQYGFWLYGNDVFNTCKGYTPDSGTILMIRKESLGFSGSNGIALHTLQSATGDGYASILNGAGDFDSGPSMVGADVSVSHPLTATFRTKLGNGTAKGVCARWDPNGWNPQDVEPWTYRRLRGIDTNIYSGLLTLVFN